MQAAKDQKSNESALAHNGDHQSILSYIQGYFKRIAAGDLGSLPIIIGLLAIALIFQSQNPVFLTPLNFVNLIRQMAGYTIIAYGVVFVLLLGEIDLSIGYVSAVAGVSVAILLRDPESGWTWYTAMGVALGATAMIGFIQGSIVTFFQVPSFIVTLAGLLVWNGVVLAIIGNGGTVIIQNDVIEGLANNFLPPAVGWGILIVSILGVVLSIFYNRRVRANEGLSNPPWAIAMMKILGISLIGLIVVGIANTATRPNRPDEPLGVPLAGLIILILYVIFRFIANNTQFGRFVYAVGGSREAARRAGINVTKIRLTVFIIASTMAGFGGIMLASRLRSVDTGAGGGNLLLNAIAAAVIGGTSLFGGRGYVASAVLGGLVIASVENGMGLLGLDSAQQFIITGIVLLIAVIVDSLSRRRQEKSGIA